MQELLILSHDKVYIYKYQIWKEQFYRWGRITVKIFRIVLMFCSENNASTQNVRTIMIFVQDIYFEKAMDGSRVSVLRARVLFIRHTDPV